MIRVMTVKEIALLVKKVSLKTFFLKLIDQLISDYQRWDEFEKCPRHATHVPGGVIELMPIADRQFYAFKYVNGHPNNPKENKLTVAATGQLSSVKNGYPLMISEMTLLTALRTAATSAMASRYLAKKNAKTFGIIGTGAQSEFQTLAHFFALGIDEIYYFDLDGKAAQKFEGNLRPYPLKLHRCASGKAVVEKSDIITTATAKKGHQKVIEASWIKEGVHINKIGGDCPGKTELDSALLPKCKIVVELLEQTKIEGEIQQSDTKIYAELWELAKKVKPGRTSNEEITLFDSVGFALEDYSVLRLIHQLAEEHNVGHLLDLIPEISDPKNLFGALA